MLASSTSNFDENQYVQTAVTAFAEAVSILPQASSSSLSPPSSSGPPFTEPGKFFNDHRASGTQASLTPSTSNLPGRQVQVSPPIAGDAVRSELGAKPRMFELCAGSAGLSAACAARGFDSIAIDCKRNRFKVKHAISNIDLACDESVDLLIQQLDPNFVTLVWAGVPCGTASKAREIPIPKWKLKFIKGPPPRQLRTRAEPWGRTDIQLTPLEQFKLLMANQVYKNVGQILLAALDRGIAIAVENPRDSYLWCIEPYSSLLQRGCEDNHFQNCAFGGERPKWTRVRATQQVLHCLNSPCPGESANHKHKPWGIHVTNRSVEFATGEEAAYPKELCTVVLTE